MKTRYIIVTITRRKKFFLARKGIGEQYHICAEFMDAELAATVARTLNDETSIGSPARMRAVA